MAPIPEIQRCACQKYRLRLQEVPWAHVTGACAPLPLFFRPCDGCNVGMPLRHSSTGAHLPYGVGSRDPPLTRRRAFRNTGRYNYRAERLQVASVSLVDACDETVCI